MAQDYNTKVEGHRGEAIRLMQMVEILTLPGKAGAAARKAHAAALTAKADQHFKAAQDAAYTTYSDEVFSNIDPEEVEVNI